jgi:hypothetical protein
MKTSLIAFLSFALIAAAYFTRPGKREFLLYLLDTQFQSKNGWSDRDIAHAESMLRGVNIQDHVLWTTVERDGRVVYSGAFSHFLPRETGFDKQVPSASQLAKLMGK